MGWRDLLLYSSSLACIYVCSEISHLTKLNLNLRSAPSLCFPATSFYAVHSLRISWTPLADVALHIYTIKKKKKKIQNIVGQFGRFVPSFDFFLFFLSNF